VAMERGGFLHEVLQDFHEHEEEWRPREAEQQREWLEAALQRRLEGYLSRMEGCARPKTRGETGPHAARQHTSARSPACNSFAACARWAVEKRFRLRLDGSEVVGKIDRVNDVGDGEVEVVDYKTGSGKPMRFAYDMYFGPELHDVQLALYYLACKDGIDEEGNPLGFQPRFLSLWYPKDWVLGRPCGRTIFSVGQAGRTVRNIARKPLTDEDLQRSRSVVVTAIERIKEGHFEPAPRELPGTCVTRFRHVPARGGSVRTVGRHRNEHNAGAPDAQRRTGRGCARRAARSISDRGRTGHRKDVHGDGAILLAGRTGRRARPDPHRDVQRACRRGAEGSDHQRALLAAAGPRLTGFGWGLDRHLPQRLRPAPR